MPEWSAPDTIYASQPAQLTRNAALRILKALRDSRDSPDESTTLRGRFPHRTAAITSRCNRARKLYGAGFILFCMAGNGIPVGWHVPPHSHTHSHVPLR